MSHELQQQIAHLETQLAFQEDVIEQLNRALADQQMQMDKLTFQVKHLVDRVKQLQPSNIADASEETPPPHY
jgi:SlyX protein